MLNSHLFLRTQLFICSQFSSSSVKARFIKFDIVEFYPSISEQLLDKSINYARSLSTIDDNVIAIIKHARKSLFDKNNIWIKKGENTMFHITMGSFDETVSFVEKSLMIRTTPTHLCSINNTATHYSSPSA